MLKCLVFTRPAILGLALASGLGACRGPAPAQLAPTFLRAVVDGSGACAERSEALNTYNLRWLHLTLSDGAEVHEDLLPADDQTRQVRFARIPTGVEWDLRLGGYRSEVDFAERIPAWLGRRTSVNVAAGAETTVQVLMTRPDTVECTRTPLGDGRAFGAAVLLEGGRVLLTGGIENFGASNACEGCRAGSASRETWFFDPDTGSFEPGPTLPLPRAGHSAVRTESGAVLLVGGARSLTLGGSEPADADPADLLESVARWTPKSGTWTQIMNMGALRRLHHTTTLLPGDELVIAGGISGAGVPTTSVLRFDVGGAQAVSLGEVQLECPRAGHVALTNGDDVVFFGGGRCENTAPESLRPGEAPRRVGADRWGDEKNITFAGAARLTDSAYLIVGGSAWSDGEFSAPSSDNSYIFAPSDGRVTNAQILPEGSAGLFPAVLALARGKRVLIAGGFAAIDLTEPIDAISEYDDVSQRFVDSERLLSTGRGALFASPAGRNLMLLAGGLGRCDECASGERGERSAEVFSTQEDH